MPKRFVVATFPDSHRLLTAVRSARNAELRIQDVYAPYPIHDLDHAMGLRRSRLPLVTLVAGATALSIALFFQFYAAVLDWNLNVGGKPDNSSLAFVPICFELTVLISGLATFALPLSAHAGAQVSIGIGLPVAVAPAPVVVAPPPPAVVYPAPVVVANPPPVVVAPPPVVYGPAPVVVGGYYGYPYRPWKHRHYGWRQW